MRPNTSIIYIAASLLFHSVIGTGDDVPVGGAQGNYVLLNPKDKAQDTIYPYVDNGAHCTVLDRYKTYAADYEMVGSIACKWYKDTDCGDGVQTSWIEPGSKGKLEFQPKAFACRLPFAGYYVNYIPSEKANEYYSKIYS